MSLVRVSLKVLRCEWRRATATALSVLLAVTAFVVLTGSSEQSKLAVQQTLDANFRSSYDILVRPKGSQTAIEQSTGRVRPNYLSGIFGGITREQAHVIGRVPGVEVSAPIAMVGQVVVDSFTPVDMASHLRGKDPQLFRVAVTQTTQRGLATTPDYAGYWYFGGTVTNGQDAAGNDVDSEAGKPVCIRQDPATGGRSLFDPAVRWTPMCVTKGGKVPVGVTVSYPVIVAAIDPAAEARLDDVDKAVTGGRYLAPTEATLTEPGAPGIGIPVLTNSAPSLDQRSTVTVDELDAATVARLRSGLDRASARALVTSAAGRRVATRTLDANDAVREPPRRIFYDELRRIGPVAYDSRPDGSLTPRVVENAPGVWGSAGNITQYQTTFPVAAGDTGYRAVTMVPAAEKGASSRTYFVPVGSYDARKVTQSSELSQVPLETYQSPSAAPGSDAAARLLGGRDLAPDTNPAGYLQSPPMVLMNLAHLDKVMSRNNMAWTPEDRAGAPISVVRVRVAGVTGADPASRERIRLVAERIQAETGLDVDITVGSSPRPTVVHLPPTKHGAPALDIRENWVQKGVVAALTTAVDKKSVILFVLILVTTSLCIAISAHASVRARRRELGVLACIGWRPGTLVRHVIAELLCIGVVAGAVGAVIAVPIGAVLGVPVPLWRAAMAVPAAVLLVLAAGAVPAVAASRSTPVEAVRPTLRAGRGPRVRLRAPESLALASLARTPGRVITAAVALAVGLAALVALVGIVVSFQGAVVGTLLGDAVAVQVRDADIVAAVVLVVIGIGALLQVLALDVQENATHYAALAASGWRDSTLARLIVAQGAVIGLLGAAGGVGLGLALLRALGPLADRALWAAAGLGVGALVLACVLSLVPALRLRRLETARLLSRD